MEDRLLSCKTGALFFSSVLRPLASSTGLRPCFGILGIMYIVVLGATSFFMRLPQKPPAPPPNPPLSQAVAAAGAKKPAGEASSASSVSAESPFSKPGYSFYFCAMAIRLFASHVPQIHAPSFLLGIGWSEAGGACVAEMCQPVSLVSSLSGSRLRACLPG